MLNLFTYHFLFRTTITACFLLFIGWKLNLLSLNKIALFSNEIVEETKYEADPLDEDLAKLLSGNNVMVDVDTKFDPGGLLTKSVLTHVNREYVDYKSSHYFIIVGPPPDCRLF